MTTRPATAGDLPAILDLNAASVAALSPLDDAALRALDAQAALHLVVEDAGTVAAFVLALREGAAYASPNYRWFAARYPRFLYVDRVVVGQGWRRQGLGRALYAAVFAAARAAGVPRVCCEYDLVPPNPDSARFHAAMGFREVGRQAAAGGAKEVSLQVAALADAVA